MSALPRAQRKPFFWKNKRHKNLWQDDHFSSELVANPQGLTIAIIVTFNPNINSLEHLLQNLCIQVEKICIVDNNSSNRNEIIEKISRYQSIHLFKLEDNLGIAAAQNTGIRWAFSQGASFILLLDQDSLPPSGMVKKLRQILQANPQCAAVGPVPVDNRINSGSNDSNDIKDATNVNHANNSISNRNNNNNIDSNNNNIGYSSNIGSNNISSNNTIIICSSNNNKFSYNSCRSFRHTHIHHRESVNSRSKDIQDIDSALVYSFTRWGPKRRSIPRPGELLAVPFILSSGSLIAVTALTKIGLMNELLFIDHVDLAWGLRAKQIGYSIMVTGDVKMSHNLGESVIRLRDYIKLPKILKGSFCQRSIHLHSPERNYYLIRNTIFLLYSPWLSLSWKFGYLFWLCKYIGFYSLIALDKIATPHKSTNEAANSNHSAISRRIRRKAMWQAILDGVCGHGGKYRKSH